MTPAYAHKTIALPKPAREKLVTWLPSSRAGWLQGVCLAAGLTLPGGVLLLGVMFIVGLVAGRKRRGHGGANPILNRRGGRNDTGTSSATVDGRTRKDQPDADDR